MKISTYSIVFSTIVVSLLFTVIYLYRRLFPVRKKSDIFLFATLYTVGFVRLLLPIDFPFAEGISIRGIFSDLWELFFYKHIGWFSAARIATIAILTTGIYKLIRFLFNYRCELKRLRQLPSYDQPQIIQVVNHIRTVFPDYPISCKIVCSGSVHIPFTIGIQTPMIVLPDIEFHDLELYYILLHELTHIQKNDLVKKMLLQIFHCMFWWIPFHSTAVKDMEQIIEINCDSTITNSVSSTVKADYMQVMISCLERIIIEKTTNGPALAFTLSGTKYAMCERFRLIAASEKRRSKKAFCIATVFTLCILSTYLYAPIPSYPAPKTEGDVTTENSYLIYENGTYYLKNQDNNMFVVPETHVPHMLSNGIKIKEENQ